MKEFIFPFTAISGQENMKLSLILNAVDPRIGGVLVKGERGTAKSTAARALADLLPVQPVISDCRFGCDPEDPLHYCDECSSKYADQEPQVRYRRTPFVNLPISITEDRLVGTIDIEKALIDGKKHFEQGLFAEANRGILYVDEVNLLDDHIVDTLLDAAAMGINHVEREGISFAHPARFIIIGTMNPEEGDLRPQLLDRFAHSVEIHGIPDASERAEIIRRTIEFENNPEQFYKSFEKSQEELAKRITIAQKRLQNVRYTKFDLYSIAELTTSFKLEGHRADIVILKTARALAAFENRDQICQSDISRAAELAIPHRLVSDHVSGGDISPEEIGTKAVKILSSIPAAAAPGEDPELAYDKKKNTELNFSHLVIRESDTMVPAADMIFNRNQAFWWDAARIIEDDFTFPLYENFKSDQKHQKGKRNSIISDNKFGYTINSIPANGDYSDIAPDATLRAASIKQADRSTARQNQERAIIVKSTDIMKKVRIRRDTSLIVFLVDLSWSMAVTKRMAATKKAITSILTKAYQSRDDVCLITFQKDAASEVIPPTHSIALAEKHMKQMKVGGKTPLSAGLQKAMETMQRACRRYNPENIILVLLSDCDGNVAIAEGDPMEEAFAAADRIASGHFRAMVINSDPMTFGQGHANRIAKHLKASCYLIADFNADRLMDVIRDELIL